MTTLWSGPSLYDGLNSQATGASDMRFLERDGLYAKMSEYEVDQYYRRAAWEFVASHPERAAQLALVKLRRYFSPLPNAAQFQNFWYQAACLASFVPMILFGGCGLWVCRQRLAELTLLITPFVYFAVLHTVFVSSLRYRLPAEYPFAVVCALGLTTICRRLTRP